MFKKRIVVGLFLLAVMIILTAFIAMRINALTESGELPGRHQHTLALLGMLICFFIISISCLVYWLINAEKAAQLANEHRQHAQAKSKAKSRFLSTMSHELRTPLNAIVGYAELLKIEGHDLTKEQGNNVSEIIAASDHLLNLVNEILDLAKIDNGRLTITLMSCSVWDLLVEAISYVHSLAKSRKVTITLPVANTDYLIKVDKTRAVQVFTNILSNAVKYNQPAGKVEIELLPVAPLPSANEACLQITVKDTGIGISKNVQSKVFKPFERFANDVSIEGTGVGLALSRQLVLLMQGQIGFRSVEGVGSDFWIQFPLAQEKSLV